MFLANVVVAVQSLSRVWLWLHGLQLTSLPLPPRVCSNSCPLIWWYHTTISSSAALFFCLQSFPASCLVFPNELALLNKWLKYWSFSFNISPSNEYSGLISFGIDYFDLLELQGTLKSLLQPHTPCCYDAVIPHSTQSLLTLFFKDQSKFIYPFVGDVILSFS